MMMVIQQMIERYAFAPGALRRLLRQRSGVTAIEYGLIASLIAVTIVGGFTVLSGSVEGLFDTTATEVDNSMQPLGGTGGTGGTTP